VVAPTPAFPSYPGGPLPGITFPSGLTPDLAPARGLVFEVAFSTGPYDATPVWVDLSSRVHLPSGITIRRGRSDEFENVPAGTLTLTLENTDGALTPENPASPYYPHVLNLRRCRLRYIDPASSDVTPLFDGYVDEWPVEWPDSGDNYSRAQITATDILARIDGRQKLRSVVVETIALDNPYVHFPLDEASGSTSVASVAGDAAVLYLEQIGTGGTLEFGSGTGVPTDGASSPVWTSASLTNGLYLTGYIGPVNTETGRWAGSGVTLSAVIASTSVLGEPVVTLSDRKGNRLQLGYNPDPDGRPFASFHPWNGDFSLGAGSYAVVGGAKLNNGTTHVLGAAITPNGAGASTFTLELFVDGVSVGSTAMFVSSIGTLDTLTIGGQAGTSAFYAGTISHVAAWGSPLTPAQFLEHSTSMSTGFAGERSDERVARVCSWIGMPAARQDLEVGLSLVGHIDPTGKNPLEYLRIVETTEAGLLFASTDGRLTLHNRSHTFSTAAPDLTVPADMLNGDARLAKNLLLVKNRVNASRIGGARVQVVDQASVDDHGYLDDDIELATSTDTALASAAAWRLFTSSTPRVRFTNLSLDGLTDPTYSPGIRALVDLNARAQVTGLPAQAPPASGSQQVQGYVLNISDSSWDCSVNAAPYAHLVALVLDDPVYGALDSYPLAY
jgi:hypothetical protein